ncbi:MAG: MaoC/PaaZ C-terminal domain-containing protein [Actinomycetota bacterium]|nr:MaoC/PaaZ C-terminal domain-containing protein [Actinomycetota bacterium]
MSGNLYFEDFSVGRVFRTAGRTVTEADVVNFAGLSGDFSSLHLDEEFAVSGPFGRRIAHGLCSVTIFSGLFVQLGLWNDTALAVLSTSWTFVGPVFLGDTIKADITVSHARITSRGDRGVVTFEVTLANQDGDTVQNGVWVMMIRALADSSKHQLENA